MLKLFKNRNLVLSLSLVLGFLISDIAQYTKSLTIPSLVVIMTLSLTDISNKNMLDWRKLPKPLALGTLMCYFVLGSLILILTYLFVPEIKLRTGMILVAAGPPGAAVIPFAAILSGNLFLALLASFGAYLAALIITPLLLLLVPEAKTFPFSFLLLNLFYLIILPILVSRVLLLKKIDTIIRPIKDYIINWSFFVFIFNLIGLNKNIFLKNFNDLFLIMVIALLTTFPLFYLLQFLFKKFGIKEDEAITLILLGTIKNSAFSSALALLLFDQVASLPGAIFTTVYALFMVWLGR